jgi:hypothetical protein
MGRNNIRRLRRLGSRYDLEEARGWGAEPLHRAHGQGRRARAVCDPADPYNTRIVRVLAVHRPLHGQYVANTLEGSLGCLPVFLNWRPAWGSSGAARNGGRMGHQKTRRMGSRKEKKVRAMWCVRWEASQDRRLPSASPIKSSPERAGTQIAVIEVLYPLEKASGREQG